MLRCDTLPPDGSVYLEQDQHHIELHDQEQVGTSADANAVVTPSKVARSGCSARRVTSSHPVKAMMDMENQHGQGRQEIIKKSRRS